MSHARIFNSFESIEKLTKSICIRK